MIPDQTPLRTSFEAELARFGNMVTCHYETLLLVERKASPEAS